MIAVAKARQYREELRLNQAAEVVESRLEAAAQKDLPYAEFLVDLVPLIDERRRGRCGGRGAAGGLQG